MTRLETQLEMPTHLFSMSALDLQTHRFDYQETEQARSWLSQRLEKTDWSLKCAMSNKEETTISARSFSAWQTCRMRTTRIASISDHRCLYLQHRLTLRTWHEWHKVMRARQGECQLRLAIAYKAVSRCSAHLQSTWSLSK